MTQDNGDQTIGRRRLLRRAGTVAAGVAGAGVVSAVTASPAQAASGAFDSATVGTPAVTVENTFTQTTGTPGNEVVHTGPQLAFTPAGDIISAQAPVGSLSMDADGFIWVRDAGTGADASINFLHTTANSNLTVPISPFRLLDSRYAAWRTNVINPTALDTSGRLKAKTWLHLDVSSLVTLGLGVIGNLVAVAPAANGFLTVVPYNGVDYSAPVSTSSLNFTKGITIANGVTAGLGGGEPGIPSDVISIYAHTAVAVIFDACGFVVDSYGRLGSATASATSAPSIAARKAASFAEKRRALVAKNPPKA